MFYHFRVPDRSIFVTMKINISKFISENQDQFLRTSKVNVSFVRIFQLDGKPDTEIIERFQNLRNCKRSLITMLSRLCSIDIERGTGWEFVLTSSSEITQEFINNWDEEERISLKKASSNQAVTENDVNMVSPTEMSSIIMQGDLKIQSEIVNQKYLSYTGNNNGSKRFSKCSKKYQNRKVNEAILLIQQHFSTITGSEFKIFINAIEQKVNPTKKRIRETNELGLAELNIPKMKKKRNIWTPEQRRYVIDRLQLLPVVVDIKLKQQFINSMGGPFKHLKWSQVRGWIDDDGNVKKRPGPKVNEIFECAVWSRLVIAIKRIVNDVNKNENIEEIKTLYNVTYSYAIIIAAAREEQKQDEWKEDNVQALQFSNGWVHCFLARAEFKRRKITREKKDCPAEDHVQAVMKMFQEILKAEDYADYQVGNLDETALNWGLGPTNIYCASDTDRGEQEVTDLKARITGVPVVLANGLFLPMYFIIKHSKSSEEIADQTTMTVIRKLHKEEAEFNPADH